jgi:hypothetical protein
MNDAIQRVDLDFYQGSQWTYRFELKDSEGDPYVISSATAIVFSAKTRIDDAELLFSVSAAADGIGGNDFANGIVYIRILSAQSGLLGTDGVYDLKATIAGEPKAICYGDLVIPRKKVFE